MNVFNFLKKLFTTTKNSKKDNKKYLNYEFKLFRKDYNDSVPKFLGKKKYKMEEVPKILGVKKNTEKLENKNNEEIYKSKKIPKRWNYKNTKRIQEDYLKEFNYLKEKNETCKNNYKKLGYKNTKRIQEDYLKEFNYLKEKNKND